MSQYPWIYQPPQSMPSGYDPAEPLLTPARRAGLLSIIMGVLMILLGGCVGALAAIPLDQFPPELREQIEQQERQLGGDVRVSLQSLWLIAAVAMLFPGVLMIVLGFFVRRGGIGPVVSLLVLIILLILLTAPTLFTGLGGLQAGNPAALMAICMVAVVLALLGLEIWFLAGAIRAAPQIWMIRTQHQSQMWQYQQNQQQFRQDIPPPPTPTDEMSHQ